MTEEFEVPAEIPAMTLAGVVFFPKAMMPLRIYEPRYREMLDDVLESHRMFALLGLDENAAKDENAYEPPLKTASVGIVRICSKSDDGTSNLLLQGISRIRVLEVVREEPYRVVKVEPLTTIIDEAQPTPRHELSQLLEENMDLGGDANEDMLKFLSPIEDDEAFVDLAAFVLCKGTFRKQRLLETLDLFKRANLLVGHLQQENKRLRLFNEAMGDFSAEDLGLN